MSSVTFKRNKSVRFLTQENPYFTQKNPKPAKKNPNNLESDVPPEKLEKYRRGSEMQSLRFKSKRFTSRLIERDNRAKFAESQSAKAESLLTEQPGFIELEEGEEYFRIKQQDIVDSSAINTSQKYFHLYLRQFGPYSVKYTRNGQYMALAGRKGHVAMMKWQDKQLFSEFNVMESVNDICYLHMETMLAVAQRQWTFIYDNQGLELHCLKSLDKVQRLEFLPYHFLLVAGSNTGFLSYLDVSVGKIVSAFPTRQGRLDVMTQNPSNGVILLGHPNGSVSMWSPSQKDPLVKMLCHGSTVQSIAVSQDGGYLSSVGADSMVRLWDLRMNYQPLSSFRQTHGGKQNVQFSQRGLMGLSGGNVLEIFQGLCSQSVVDSRPKAYLTERFDSFIQGVMFCPFEDVVGVGYAGGVSSIIVPGAGEPNIDALESNPFRTKKQRQNTEVRMLLEKIQPELISMDNSLLGTVDKIPGKSLTVKDVVDNSRAFEPKKKTRRMFGSVGVHKRKLLVRESKKIEAVRESKSQRGGTLPEKKFEPIVYNNPLDRFN